jgi:hypothetical protein
MIPNFFLTIIVQVCTNRTKYVLNPNCPTSHVAPNMAKNTYTHGHMEKERLVLELGKKNYMDGHMALIPRC